ncbi:MAG: GNAT family N-acetyltransferase [Candidatus Bathyarchaeia archaeon]
MTVQVRDFIEKDLSALVKLLNEMNEGSYEYIPLTEDDVRVRIQEGKFRTLMAEENGEAVGSVTYNDGFWGEEIRWLVVQERPERKPVENALVSQVEKCVHGETVFTSVDAGSPRTNDWIERGYKPEGGLYQMIAKLEHVRPLPAVPEGVTIRGSRPGEEKRVVETVNLVFGWERLKQDFIERGKVESPPFDEEWVHLATLQDRILSVVVAWPAVKYNELFSGRRGYLGPAATVPEFRSRKLASALTVRAMNFLFEKGMDTAVLHTSELNVPSVTLLRNIGFEVGHHVKFLRRNFMRKS